MDKLYIKGLALKTTIGCLDWEKQVLQTVILDIEMGIDCQAISQMDRIDTTIDYVTLATQLGNFAATLRCELIETLIEKIADYIHQHYPTIPYLKISLAKSGAISGATVGVFIERNY